MVRASYSYGTPNTGLISAAHLFKLHGVRDTKILFGVLREISAMEINVKCKFRKTFDWQPRCFASETTEVYRYDVIPRASTVGLSEQSGKDLVHHEVKCTMVFDIDSIVCTFVKHASPGIVLNTLGLE